MIEICHIAADNLSGMDVLNQDTISQAISNLVNTDNVQVVVTDPYAKTIYYTGIYSEFRDKYLLLPEILQALDGNDVFRWTYRDGSMCSYAAVPVYNYGSLTACIYMTEYDTEQGLLITALQSNILTVTIILELAVIFFSFLFSNAHTHRIRKIMTSIRTVRDGDYDSKLNLPGHDELSILSSEFNELIDRLQTSENKRNQFVSDASHELKTPLASIKLLSDSILQNQMDMDTINEFVADIGNEADRLNRMSQKLLTLSKIDDESGRAELTPVVPTIERVIRMLSPAAQSNSVTVQMYADCSPSILIPEDDLYQIIFNLVENGIKYNKTDGLVTVTVKQINEKVIIHITDTGVGIPEESLSHIFERFYRVDKARSRSTGGSGLGLSIVRNIVKRRCGEIKVESQPNVGTKFILSFPFHDIKEEIL